MNEAIEKNTEAVEEGIAEMVTKQAKAMNVGALPPVKSFAPPASRGIHELIEEIEELVAQTDERVQAVKKRLSEFDVLQRRFYNGTTK